MSGPVGQFRSGKNSRVQVNGTNMTHADYSVTYKGDDIDTNNFEAAGYDQGTIGLLSLEGNCKGGWDTSINPTVSDPPGIFPRDNLLNVKVYVNLTDNLFWNVPQSRVLSAENTSQVKGRVDFNWNWKSNGSGFSAP